MNTKGLRRSLLTEHSPAGRTPNSLAVGTEGRERLLREAGSLCWARRLKVSLLLTTDTVPHVPRLQGAAARTLSKPNMP